MLCLGAKISSKHITLILIATDTLIILFLSWFALMDKSDIGDTNYVTKCELFKSTKLQNSYSEAQIILIALIAFAFIMTKHKAIWLAWIISKLYTNLELPHFLVLFYGKKITPNLDCYAATFMNDDAVVVIYSTNNIRQNNKIRCRTEHKLKIISKTFRKR